MNTRLVTNAIVANDGSRIWITVDDTTMQIRELNEPVKVFTASLIGEISGLAKSAEGKTLLTNLQSQGWLLQSEDSAKIDGLDSLSIPNVVIYELADALLAPSTIVDAPNDILIVTADDALMVPKNTQAPQVTTALRLYISGFKHLWRRSSYSLTFQSQTRRVWNDVPTKDLVLHTYSLTCESSEPTVLDFATNTLSTIGKLPGRLSVVQEIGSPSALKQKGSSLWKVNARQAAGDLFSYGTEEILTTTGIDADPDLAQVKAIGEAVERFAMSDKRQESFTFSKPSELDAPYLDPVSVMNFSANQRKRRPELKWFNPNEKYFWVRGNALDGSPIYILDCLVYSATSPHSPSTQTWFHSSSNGVAAHTDETLAKTAAHNELVERYAIMLTWLQRQRRAQINPASLPNPTKEIIEMFTDDGWDVRLLDINQGKGSAFLAVAHSERGLILGASAGDPLIATHKALCEVAASITTLGPIEEMDVEDVVSPLDHQMLSRHSPYLEHGASVLTAHEVIDLADLQFQPPTPSDKTVFVRLDHEYPGVENVQVWRCIDPELVPISFGFDNEPLAHPRIGGKVDDSQPLQPHPFP